jgi:hypothetical protein
LCRSMVHGRHDHHLPPLLRMVGVPQAGDLLCRRFHHQLAPNWVVPHPIFGLRGEEGSAFDRTLLR